MEVSILQEYEEGFVSAHTKCNCIGIVASCDVIFCLCCVSVLNRIREMRNEDVIARAFAKALGDDKVDMLNKAFEGYLESEEQIIGHKKLLEEIHEQNRSQQRGRRKHLQ